MVVVVHSSPSLCGFFGEYFSPIRRVSFNKGNIWIFFCYICFSSENQSRNRKTQNTWVKQLLFCLFRFSKIFCHCSLQGLLGNKLECCATWRHQASSVFLELLEYQKCKMYFLYFFEDLYILLQVDGKSLPLTTHIVAAFLLCPYFCVFMLHNSALPSLLTETISPHQMPE